MIPLPGLTGRPLTAVEDVIHAALGGILSLSSSVLSESQRGLCLFLEKTEVWGLYFPSLPTELLLQIS